MTSQTRSINKGRFEDGDSLSGSNFVDLIDSFLSLADTTAQVVTSDIQTPRIIATTEVSTPTLNVTDVNASVVNAAIVSAGRINTHGYVSASSARIPILDGPVQIGTNARNRGRVVLAQQTTVNASTTVNTTVANLPVSSDVLDIEVFVTNLFASAGVTAGEHLANIRIGTSANETAFGVVQVSGRGRYRIPLATFTSAATSWLSLNSANSRIMAQVTAQGSGAINSAASAVINVTYLHKT